MGDKVLIPEYGGTKVIFDEKVSRCVGVVIIIPLSPPINRITSWFVKETCSEHLIIEMK